MDVIQIATEIENRIKQIKTIRESIRDRGIAKARAIIEYEKAMAITIIDMKNGVEFELNGHKIVKPPATSMKEIAKGICWEEKLAMEEADALYRSATSNLDGVEAELNGYQSLNRYLDRA